MAIKVTRKNKPSPVTTLPPEVTGILINNPVHPVLKSAYNQWKSAYHESILHLKSIDGCRPSFNVPVTVIIPTTEALKTISLPRNFKIVDALEDKSVLFKKDESLTIYMPICSLIQWFMGMAQEMESCDDFFSPRRLAVLQGDIPEGFFQLEYMEHFGYSDQPLKSDLMTLDVFSYLTNDVVPLDEKREDLTGWLLPEAPETAEG